MTDERRRSDRRIEDLATKAIAERVVALEETVHKVITPQLGDVARELTENTRLVQEGNASNLRIEDATRDIIEAVEAAKDLWDFLKRWGDRLRRWSYSGARWVTAVAGAFAALFTALKAGADIDLIDHLLTWWRK